MLSHRSRSRFGGLVAATACVVSLASCGGDAPTVGGTVRGDPGSAGASGSAAAPGAGEDRSASWPGASDDRDVVARRRVSAARPDDAPASVRPSVDLLIRGLTVRGKVATLRITAIPRGWGDARAATGGAPTLYDLNPGPSAEYVSAQLIDVQNLRRHQPLEDSEGESGATLNYAGKSGDDRPIDATWLFAAPPGDVSSMDVQVGNWPIFREVPVTRR